MEQTEYQAALQALRLEYEQALPSKIAEITRAGRDACAGAGNGEDSQSLLRLAHSLAGSGATYGFPRVSQAARAVELFVKGLPGDSFADDAKRAQLETLLAELQKSILPEEQEPAPRDPNFVRPVASPTYTRAARTVWLYVADPEAACEMNSQLGFFGYDVQSGSEHDALPRDLGAQYAALLLDWDAAQREFSRAELADITQLHQAQPTLPVLFLAEHDDLAARLEAVRQGATGYLVKPLVISQLVELLDAQTGRRSEEPFRILIVEDDSAQAAFYATVLEQAGMLTQRVTDPLQVMAPLIEFRPDLILMDMYMPHISGLELAAVLRQQEAYVSIPIVFLSSETDINKQLSAMLLGGDDFLRKPIAAQHLISSITSRVQRARVLRGLAERDSLTGLLNHTRFKEQLGVEVSRAMRTGMPLTCAMLDIDHFKTVNDTYGHPTGDRILKNLARVLKQRLRKTDILGRYGGEEFAVIMPETHGADAQSLMDALCRAFAEIHHQSAGVEFHVTISIGLATTPPWGDTAQLNQAADRALYLAKTTGRNRVVWLAE